ncbi:MAG: hypothetical protein QOF62_8 [Pyrinomonadaceae bacterium]|jgi:hypothetical protein|nr:hypothetical protein [Pyrinomonadaceae bacterium]
MRLMKRIEAAAGLDRLDNLQIRNVAADERE